MMLHHFFMCLGLAFGSWLAVQLGISDWNEAPAIFVVVTIGYLWGAFQEWARK